MGSLIKYAHYNNLNKLVLCNTKFNLPFNISFLYLLCVTKKMKFYLKFNMGNLRRDSENGVVRDSYDPKQIFTAGAEVQHAISSPACEQRFYYLSV